MTSSPFPLFLNPPPPPPSLSFHRPKHFLTFSLSLSKSHLCFSSSSSFQNTPSPEEKDFLWLREEQRWLREEQRWLREEQRWLREEQRWLRERDSLIHEIASLKLQIEALKQRISVQEVELVPETIENVRALLQVLNNEKNRIPETGSGQTPSLKPSPVLEEEEVKEVIKEKKRITLRKGSEGDDVREMQEALLKLGFYSGEEDMEFSSFSSGTERAVKTWQSTFGAQEDGIMTAELLEKLYTEQRIKVTGTDINVDKKQSTLTVSQKEVANGAAVASVTEISETQKKIVSDTGTTEVNASQHRVFLLGENRWEEPSRLVGKDKQVGVNKSKASATKCLTCRGEGRLMCTECDGSGELNVEPQFLEWVEEGANCPYCEGLGYTICDVCEGKTAV